MKLATKSLLACTAAAAFVGSAQADTIVYEDFEDATVTYTTQAATGTEFTDGQFDYWTRTDNSTAGFDVAGTLPNSIGGSWVFASNDLDAGDGQGSISPKIQYFNDLDIAGLTDLSFSFLAGIIYNSNNSNIYLYNTNWAPSQTVVVRYQIDDGGFTDLLTITEADADDGTPAISGGDIVGETVLDNNMESFSGSIAGTGSLLDIQIVWGNNQGNTAVAIDDVLVTGEVPEPGSLALLGLGGLLMASRRRRGA